MLHEKCYINSQDFAYLLIVHTSFTVQELKREFTFQMDLGVNFLVKYIASTLLAYKLRWGRVKEEGGAE